jgi:hypothetical protein
MVAGGASLLQGHVEMAVCEASPLSRWRCYGATWRRRCCRTRRAPVTPLAEVAASLVFVAGAAPPVDDAGKWGFLGP